MVILIAATYHEKWPRGYTCETRGKQRFDALALGLLCQ
ncbi:MAG: hypothetical protein QOK02_6549 [Mycobacterium sp.]|nr:hypothetical protein [Mycobacterium sp.]